MAGVTGDTSKRFRRLAKKQERIQFQSCHGKKKDECVPDLVGPGRNPFPSALTTQFWRPTKQADFRPLKPKYPLGFLEYRNAKN
jgi:hypothetical protein